MNKAEQKKTNTEASWKRYTFENLYYRTQIIIWIKPI